MSLEGLLGAIGGEPPRKVRKDMKQEHRYRYDVCSMENYENKYCTDIPTVSKHGAVECAESGPLAYELAEPIVLDLE